MDKIEDAYIEKFNNNCVFGLVHREHLKKWSRNS